MSADGNFLKMTRSRILPLVGGSWYCAYAESRRTIDSSLQTLKIPLARLAFHLSNRQIADVHANLATWRCLWAPLWPEIWQIIRYAYIQRESKVSVHLEGTTFIRKLFHMRAIHGPNWLSALFENFWHFSVNWHSSYAISSISSTFCFVGLIDSANKRLIRSINWKFIGKIQM